MDKSCIVNNNISLHYISMKKLKTTSVGVYIHRPLNQEEASMNALLPYVLKRGCKMCKNSTEIAHFLENLYGANLSAGVLKKGEDHIIEFDAETISDKFAANNEELISELVSLLLSVIFEPILENGAFKEEYVEQEKKNAIDRLERVINDKKTYTQLCCMQEMCKDEPFSVNKLGATDSIKKITALNLYNYYKRMISNSAIDIFICGKANAEAIIEKIKKINIPFEKAEIPRTKLLKKTSSAQNITHRMDVTQGKLCMGFRTNISGTDKAFPALMVANSIFGSGAHSKLFNNVREKLSLCYYAASSLERFKGLMLVNAGIEFKNFQKAHDEILVQLDAVKQGNISDFEFEASKTALINGYQTAYDDPGFLQSFQLSEIVANSKLSISDYIKMISEVTKDAVIDAICKTELDTVYFLTGKDDAE